MTQPNGPSTRSLRKSVSKNKRKKRRYVPVLPDQRLDLIRLVCKEFNTIKDAATKLGINYSTAKHIIKQHQLAGDEK